MIKDKILTYFGVSSCNETDRSEGHKMFFSKGIVSSNIDGPSPTPREEAHNPLRNAL